MNEYRIIMNAIKLNCFFLFPLCLLRSLYKVQLACRKILTNLSCEFFASFNNFLHNSTIALELVLNNASINAILVISYGFCNSVFHVNNF